MNLKKWYFDNWDKLMYGSAFGMIVLGFTMTLGGL